MNLSVTPILPVSERKREENAALQARKPIDSKIRGFVLERIAHTKGGLLPSASAPEIIIGLLPGFESGKIEPPPREKKKAKHRKTPHPRKAPIGLMPVDPEGWLNALMQFILYVPGFTEGVSFAPRSFYPIQEFIDHYHQDCQENRSLSLVNGGALHRFFSLKLPGYSLTEIFRYLISLLHPKWEVHQNIEEALKSSQCDLFVTQSTLKKQIFVDPSLYYDLDAFIEMRPDGGSVNYITYVKVEGSWFQCDNERITQMRSDTLCVPMQKGILFHYKRITFVSAHLTRYL
jgi:hypothetical protein